MCAVPADSTSLCSTRRAHAKSWLCKDVWDYGELGEHKLDLLHLRLTLLQVLQRGILRVARLPKVAPDLRDTALEFREACVLAQSQVKSLATRSSVRGSLLEPVVPALDCLSRDLHIQEGGPLACQQQILQGHQVIKPVRVVVQVVRCQREQRAKRLAQAQGVIGGDIFNISKWLGLQRLCTSLRRVVE